MTLTFDCPVCSSNLQISTTSISGPCPHCASDIVVSIRVAPLERVQITPSQNQARQKKNWRCSGKPHGTFLEPVS